jgi:hypothetical protein
VLIILFTYNALKLYNLKRGVMMESTRSDQDNNQDDDHISNMPPEVLLKIGTLSGVSGLYNLIRTSKQMSSLCFFKDYQEALKPLKQLLSHGALGELEAAEKIWREYPDLLTCRGTIYHPNRCYSDAQGQPLDTPIDIPFEQNPGRYKYVNRTFWQILIMNGEYEEAEEAGKLMPAEEKQKQFDEIFPDGKMIKYDWNPEKAKELLRAVFDAIAADDTIRWNEQTKSFEMSEITRQKLDALYRYAKPKSEHETGLVFPADFYLEAQTMYDNESDKAFKNKWDKYSLWSVRVEAWLAGCLGTGFLRGHSQGIGNKSHRAGCVLSDGSSYFRRPSESVPGRHFFVGYYGLGGGPGLAALRVAWRSPLRVGGAFSKLMSSKNESRDRIYAAICASREIEMPSLLKALQ